MPLKGTLETWNDDRGFGFIAPAGGGRKLFVHISVFPRDAPRPAAGEAVVYEAGYGADGRERAIRAHHEGYRPTPPAPSYPLRSRQVYRGSQTHRSSLPGGLGVLLLLGASGFFFFANHDSVAKGTAWFSELLSPQTAPKEAALEEAALEETAPAFACDGRVHCSQMSSCREATFFLRNCPGTKMDGDYDGIPCERQWCTGSFAD